jgi:hypothetical protein
MADPALPISAPSSREMLSTGPPAPPGWDVRGDTLPENFGRYRIRRLLGRGGMGSVYLAHDTELDRPVALKVPRFTAEEGSDVLERFRREARAAATLSHPGICSVYDVGVQDGIPFLTMAYVEGRTLAALLKAGPPPAPRQAAALVRKLAGALAEAHRRGVIHRDLKPSNVMIAADGEPVLMDFGLARRAAAADPALTREGQVLGTPAYMAPEQAAGEPVGPACDVYGLGVLLYELLTGQLPFKGEKLSELLARVLAAPPPPPSSYRPDLDPALEAICLKALAKSPAQRYASMTEFAAALDAYLRSAGAASAGVETQSWPLPATRVVKAEPAPIPPARGRTRGKWLVGSAALLSLGAAVWLALARLTNHGNPAGSGTGEKGIEHRVAVRDELAAIRDHLERTAPEDRPYQRYFTLAHLAGGKGKDDLRGYAAGLSRLLRSLGGGKVEAVDREETVFAIDLRRGDWNRGDTWEDRILKSYPYGLRLQGHFDPAVSELAAQVARRAAPHWDVVCVRGDWFAARRSRLFQGQEAPGVDEGLAALRSRYERDVGPEDAARELGIADVAELLRRIKDNPDLRKRGLGVLAEGETIPRRTWESFAGRTVSLFQEAAELLGCGTPVTFFDE